ncbi:MAG: amidohydrolase family protein [Myxococcota bacterium]|nr:amidohydrolase family protein [Myxococcota bacterium]
MTKLLSRREFVAGLSSAAAGLALPACGRGNDPDRYTEADVARLAAQRVDERTRSGRGPFGPHRYRGYRGLAELPWFELDGEGRLRCVADDFPPAIDMHCHLGMSFFLAPDLDLLARSPRVEHLLDCDAADPGCELDLDVYINANFTESELGALRRTALAQATIGSRAAATQTIPNLLAEMDASRLSRALILPIAFGVPFGDDLARRWRVAIARSGASDRFVLGGSVHPRDPDRVAKLEEQAAAGARVIKLHPTVQRFYPDDPEVMDVYAACDRLGLAVFFHCGRAGIEPESIHRYALPRHYEGALSAFPDLPFVLGHAGARDVADAVPLARRHENAWLGIHGQGVTQLHEMLEATGGQRMLFGSDWPFYHVAATLAKVLIVTEDREAERHAILRGNAERLLGDRVTHRHAERPLEKHG